MAGGWLDLRDGRSVRWEEEAPVELLEVQCRMFEGLVSGREIEPDGL